MFKNYLKVAIRTLNKQRFYSGINILGLTIGITSSILILLYLVDELSYDRFHSDADRIFRVTMNARLNGNDFLAAVSSAPMAGAAVAELPGTENATRLYKIDEEVTRFQNIIFTEKKVFFADSNFFDFFSFDLIKGDPKVVLKDPQSLVLTEDFAIKYFGSIEAAIGEMMELGTYRSLYKVTGIAANPPANSHFNFDILLSMASFPPSKEEIWLNNNIYTYLKLQKDVDLSTYESQLMAMVDKRVGPQMEQMMGRNLQQFREQGGRFGYMLQPLTDIHLKSSLQAEIQPNGNLNYVYIFVAIALFILLIACINFMNLATARSAKRAKEVGLRKTLGSDKRSLVLQFLAESMFYSFIAIILSILLVYVFLEPFNQLSGKELSFNLFLQPWILLGLICISLIVGLVAGSYPAFYLTSFQPVDVLKGKIRAGMKDAGLRSSLVVFQFVISIGLIACTFLVFGQLNYMQDKKLGLDKENVLIISNGNRLNEKVTTLKQALLAESVVKDVSISSSVPPGIENNTVWKAEGSDQDYLFGFHYADHGYQNTMEIEMASGRYFSTDFPSDTAAVVLNEAAVKQLGWDDPIGKHLVYPGNQGNRKLTVVGVMKDFNYEDLKTVIRPVCVILSERGNFISVRLKPENIKESLAKVEEVYKRIAPDEPFQYTFMDEDFALLFEEEQKLGSVLSMFTGLAIFIASLGLLGLAAFTAEQRTKEIGVRKILGASSLNLTLLLSKEFFKLVLIAFVFAVPLSWYMMQQWLNSFAYRMEIYWGVFAVAGLLALVVALLTVSFQAIKASRSNPVKSLKYE